MHGMYALQSYRTEDKKNNSNVKLTKISVMCKQIHFAKYKLLFEFHNPVHTIQHRKSI